MEKIALLGPSNGEWCLRLNSKLRTRKVEWGWTQQHEPVKLQILRDQISGDFGKFKIYAYNTYNKTTDKQLKGLVTNSYDVSRFYYDKDGMDPPHHDILIGGEGSKNPNWTYRGWYDINKGGFNSNIRNKWTEFRDYDTGDYLEFNVPWNPNVYWKYVIDEF